jgi:hypothetical protein
MKTNPQANSLDRRLNHTWLTWVRAHKDALTITALLTVLLFETFYLRGWTYPILGDRSFHLYSAQEIARGRIPYVDFHNNHPPLAIMLIALPMWIFPKLMTGAGPAYVHIAWTVLWTAIGVVATYHVGKRITGSWLGGALAGWLLVGLTPLLIIHAVVGENRILVISAMIMAVAFMQRDRWFWAGLAVGIGFMTYYPTLLAATGAWVLITGKRGPSRWRGLGHFGLGLAVPVAFTLSWLAARQALSPWISDTLRWLVPYGVQTSSGILGEGASGLGARLSHSTQTFSRAYSSVGDWILIIAALCYFAFIIVALVKPGRRLTVWSDPKTVPMLMVSTLSISYTLIEGGEGDRMLALPFIAAWAAFGITSILKFIEAWHIGFNRAGLMALTAFSVVSSGRVLGNIRQEISVGKRGGVEGTNLQTQIRATDALEAFLPPKTHKLVMGELWPLVISGQENASSFYHCGPKMRLAAKLSGTVADSIYEEVLRARPGIVIFQALGREKASYDQLAALLIEDGYVCVGLAHRLGIFIMPDNAQALAGAVAMQQAFVDEMSQPSQEIPPAQIASMTNIQIREVAPGMLLIAHELLETNGVTELDLYWWTWMQAEMQTPIRLEIATPGATVASWQVAQPALPANIVTRERIVLSELDGLPEDSVIRLVAATESPVEEHPCKCRISQEPVVLHVETAP